MHRAYSILEVKSLDDETRKFSGIATTPSLDRVSDRVDPTKATFAKEIPLLHAHNHAAPIGFVRLGKATKAGIPFEAFIPKIDEPPTLKERVDVAYGEIKHGLVAAVSIGFRPTEQGTYNKDGGIDFGGIEIMELSTVAIPAQAEAIIQTVKSLDAKLRAEAGAPEPEVPSIPATTPAATGTKRVVKLATPPARDRAFTIRSIVRTK